jgi:hypothetical protein
MIVTGFKFLLFTYVILVTFVRYMLQEVILVEKLNSNITFLLRMYENKVLRKILGTTQEELKD